MAPPKSAKKTQTAKLQFHYIKGPGYREVPCDGAIGGIAPRKSIVMSFFAERGPIPRLVEYEVVQEAGTDVVNFNEGAATPTHVETRRGVIRHIEFTTYLDLDVAKRIHSWLGKRIAEASGETTRTTRTRGKK
jgi:hypothetical protein